MAKSPQTLSEADRANLALWAADCAERVLWLFERERPDDGRPRAALARTRAFGLGELKIGEAIRQRLGKGSAARDAESAVAGAAAKAAGQASAVCHMGAHALGAAAYALDAVALAASHGADALEEELAWQLGHMAPDVRAALRSLPPVGTDRSGPLGPGLLASGRTRLMIEELQRRLL